jgi:hypothetical protein
MKHCISIALLLIITACNNQSNEQKVVADTLNKTPETVTPGKKIEPMFTEKRSGGDSLVFSNKRFREVRVQKINDTTFKVTGKARVFEANFEWNVKEDNAVVKKGHTTTDAGAPEFGNFSFTVTAKKKTPSSKLEIVIFEPSANDGTPQGELPIPLN